MFDGAEKRVKLFLPAWPSIVLGVHVCSIIASR